VRVQYKRKQQARIALAILIVAIGGCNSDGTATPTSKPATTLPPGDSAVATRSTTTTTSTTTTSLAPTTLAPTTTTIPIEQQIKDAIQAYFLVYQACGLSPTTCDVTQFAATGSVAEEKGRSYFGEMASRNLRFDSDPTSYLLTTKVVAQSATDAVADLCVFDDSRILGPTGPDSVPAVIADGNSSFNVRQTWVIEAGRWKVRLEERLDTIGAGDLCGR
jgi:hypothetical protein